MSSRRVAGAMSWAAGLAAAALALHWAGHGPLAAPPLADPARWPAWLDSRGPVEAAFSLVRLAALAGLWYLAAAMLVGALVRLTGAVALVRVTDRLTIGPVRRVLAGGVSLGLAASGVVAVAAPALRAPALAQTTTTQGAPATLTMHRIGPADTPGPSPAAPVPSITPAAPAPSAAPATATSAAVDRWTVRPGECFWSIAERVLTDRWGRAPTDGEIVPYWRRLIDANRTELAQRDNPDLIFPGQVFTVPNP